MRQRRVAPLQTGVPSVSAVKHTLHVQGALSKRLLHLLTTVGEEVEVGEKEVGKEEQEEERSSESLVHYWFLLNPLELLPHEGHYHVITR